MTFTTYVKVSSARTLARRALAKMKRFNHFSDLAVASRLLAAKDKNPLASVIHRSIADDYDQLASLADDNVLPILAVTAA